MQVCSISHLQLLYICTSDVLVILSVRVDWKVLVGGYGECFLTPMSSYVVLVLAPLMTLSSTKLQTC